VSNTILNKTAFSYQADHPWMHVYLVRRQRWQSHNSLSHIQKNPTLQANLTAPASIELKLLFHIARTENFGPFCRSDLDLDPLTFIHEFDPYPLKISPQTKNEVYKSSNSKVIVFLIYRQMPPKTLLHRLARVNSQIHDNWWKPFNNKKSTCNTARSSAVKYAYQHDISFKQNL